MRHQSAPYRIRGSERAFTTREVLSSRERTVTFVNAAGWGNAGDDSLVREIVAEVVNAAKVAHITNVGGPGAASVLSDLASSVSVISPDTSHYRAKIAVAIATSSLVVIGGGGLLHDRVPLFYRQFSRAAALARLIGTPYVVYGVGAYAPKTSAFASSLKKVVEGAAYVSVRDEASAAAIREVSRWPVDVFGDPAFVAKSSVGVTNKPTSVLGLNIRPWGGTAQQADDEPHKTELLREVAEGVAEFATAHDMTVALIPIQNGGLESDLPLLEALSALLPPTVPSALVACEGPSGTVDAFAACDVVLGMRLHSLVLATAAGVPTVGLAYEGKVEAIMSQMDRAEVCLPLSARAFEIVRALEIAVANAQETGERNKVINSAAAGLGKLGWIAKAIVTKNGRRLRPSEEH